MIGMLVLKWWELSEVTSGILAVLLVSIGGLIAWGFRHRFEKSSAKIEVDTKEKTTSQDHGYIAGIDDKKGYKSRLRKELRDVDDKL